MNDVANLKEEKEIVSGMFSAMSTASIVYGIILIIISMFLFTSPGKSYMLVTTLLGIYLVVKGIIDFIAVFNSNNSNKGMILFASVVYFISGFIVLSATMFATVFLVTLVVYVIGFSFILSGIVGFKESVPMAIVNIMIGFLMLFFEESVAIGFIWLISFMILLGGVFSIIFGATAKNVAREISA